MEEAIDAALAARHAAGAQQGAFEAGHRAVRGRDAPRSDENERSV
jgi:hypothetical protein